eukprot:FR735179.1.p1 GENE.FR735179.1~~FR735179.1.p1  ORF type:complete len:113 (+),score=1.66 FR735179.1:46-339(+)
MLSSYDTSGRRSPKVQVERSHVHVTFGKQETFEIPTRQQMTQSERQQMWYDKFDVHDFVGQEIQRRKLLGMTSTNVLVSKSVKIEEEADEGWSVTCT